MVRAVPVARGVPVARVRRVLTVLTRRLPGPRAVLAEMVKTGVPVAPVAPAAMAGSASSYWSLAVGLMPVRAVPEGPADPVVQPVMVVMERPVTR